MEDSSVVYPEWQHQALPVLGWIKAREDSHGGAALLLVTNDFDQISRETGLPADQVTVQITRLMNGGFVLGERMQVLGQRSPVGFKKVGLTLAGLQAVGAWPGPPSLELVMSMLESVASGMPTGSQERSGIEKLMDGLKSLGRDTFIHVLSELAKMGAGKAMGLC